ncbi:MAG: hypothetical protein PHE84_13230 [bacterium]|nr:hypothetical protein [bacterium]
MRYSAPKMHKIRKYILTVLFILVFAANSQAYSLREGNILLAEYGQHVTGSVGTSDADKADFPPKLKSPSIAFGLASIPLIMFAGISVNELIYPVDKDGYSENWLPILFFTAFLSAFTTLPAHLYVHSGGGLALFLTSLIPITYASISLSSPDFPDSNLVFLALFSPWIVTYLYELIDAPLAAKRYNEKVLQQSGLFVVPMAAKGEGRLLVGYRF